MYYYWVYYIFSFLMKDEIVYSEPGEDLPLPQITIPGVEDYSSAFFKMTLSLLFFVAFAGFSLWYLKRIMQKRRSSHPEKMIKLIEKKVLSPKSAVYLVEIEGKKILISESQLDMRMSPLSETLEEELSVEESNREEEVLV